MKQQYMFPAVLYYDEDNNNYAVAFKDIDVFTEGDTVEDAYLSAKDYLIAYLQFSKHLNNEIEKATSYVIVKQEHPNDIVLLVNCEDDENSLKNDSEIDSSINDEDDLFED